MDTLRSLLADPLLLLVACAVVAALGGYGGRSLALRIRLHELDERFATLSRRISRREGEDGAEVKRSAVSGLPPGLQSSFLNWARSMGAAGVGNTVFNGPEGDPEAAGIKRAHQIFEREPRKPKGED